MRSTRSPRTTGRCWLASVLVMALAVALALTGGEGAGGEVLSLVAPLVAAAGVAGVYGPQRDPAFEVLAATVTSPRLVLLARVTLVFGYDLALAVAASVVLRLGGTGEGLVDLVTAWLGPMTLLLALSLVLAMWIGPTLSMVAAGALWLVRALTIADPDPTGGWLADGMRVVWATSPATGAVTLVLVLAAAALSRRPDRPRSRAYRPATP